MREKTRGQRASAKAQSLLGQNNENLFRGQTLLSVSGLFVNWIRTGSFLLGLMGAIAGIFAGLVAVGGMWACCYIFPPPLQPVSDIKRERRKLRTRVRDLEGEWQDDTKAASWKEGEAVAPPTPRAPGVNIGGEDSSKAARIANRLKAHSLDTHKGGINLFEVIQRVGFKFHQFMDLEKLRRYLFSTAQISKDLGVATMHANEIQGCLQSLGLLEVMKSKNTPYSWTDEDGIIHADVFPAEHITFKWSELGLVVYEYIVTGKVSKKTRQDFVEEFIHAMEEVVRLGELSLIENPDNRIVLEVFDEWLKTARRTLLRFLITPIHRERSDEFRAAWESVGDLIFYDDLGVQHKEGGRKIRAGVDWFISYIDEFGRNRKEWESHIRHELLTPSTPHKS